MENNDVMVAKSDKQNEALTTASIIHALDIERCFKLYSYRLISQEQFMNDFTSLAKEFIKIVKQIEKES